METEIVKHDEVELKIKDKKHEVTFTFRDGEMTNVTSNLSYRKNRAEWKFFGEAITLMLKKSKGFYKNPKKVENPF